VLTPRERAFYDRDVHTVARELLGCIVRHGETAGRIVETESYHESEPACHAHIGLTARTHPLFEPAGIAYVYRSYGIHALLNAVAEDHGVGAAVLIRAIEPTDGVDLMRERRAGITRLEDLANGPGKLTQALGIGLELNGSSLVEGPIQIDPPPEGAAPPDIVLGERIGITKAAELPWRFCDASSRCVSRPWPKAMRQPRAANQEPRAASRQERASREPRASRSQA
jgi:DNA-3-methyladenine glycosylase